MRRLEDALQRAVVTYLRTVLPADQWRVCAIPNGGARSKAEAAIMKGTGTLAGMPDLMVLGRGRAFFFECKSARGHLSPAQVEMHDWLRLSGHYPVAVVRSLDEVRRYLAWWEIETRDTRAA